MFLLLLFVVFGVWLFFRLTVGYTTSAKCLVGKTALVTGGNSGIGYQVCLNLASRGCKVMIADKDDAEESRRKIVKASGNPHILVKKLDLSSFKSVRQLASDIIKTEPKLDILINNAGVGFLPEGLSEDGLDLVMQTNHFGPFLLTYLLIDLLKRSSPSRIIITSSYLAFVSNPRFSVATISGKPVARSHSLSGMMAYGNSKLAQLMVSDVFAEKLRNTGVTCNSLNPGNVKTPMWAKSVEFKQPGQLLAYLAFAWAMWLSGKSPWEGSQTTTHLAVSDEVENVSGEYFWECKPFIKPWQARNGALKHEIWRISEKCVGISDNERL